MSSDILRKFTNLWQLFSASAVIESRASTRLGENVKLLTYVSIFYLPLAFCTVCSFRSSLALATLFWRTVHH